MIALLADDEELTLNYLEKIIDWKALGITTTKRAKNGKEAFGFIESNKPDIVITDIRMPIMDGLKLIEKIREINREIRIIVLSAFGDFEYARKAYDFGITGYILKPVNEEKLEDLLRAAVDEIKTNQNQIIKKQFSNTLAIEALLKQQILHPVSDDSFYSRLNLVEEKSKFNHFQMIYLIGTNDFPLSKDMIIVIKSIWEEVFGQSMIIFESIPEHWIIVTETKIGTSLAQTLYSKVGNSLGEKLFIGISGNHHGPGEMIMAYNELEIIRALRFYSTSESFVIYKKSLENRGQDLVLLDEVDHLFHLVRKKKKDDINQFIDDLTSRMRESFGPAIDEYTGFSHALLVLIRSRLKKSETPLFIPEILIKINIEYVKQLPNASGITHFIKQVIDQIISEPVYNLDSRDSELIKKTKDYIINNYSRNFSLSDLGEHLQISKNYLCRIFKNTTDLTVWDYLTKTRIKMAKLLLDNSTLKTGEIAEKIGYEKAGYFSSVFKKHTGFSPNQYRSRISGTKHTP